MMKLTDIGDAPFLEILSYLTAPDVVAAQSVCRALRRVAQPLAWVELEKTMVGATGQDAMAQARCCRYEKARRYAQRMEGLALAHYDFGFGVKEKDVEEGGKLSPYIAALMVPGGLVVSQQPLIGFEHLDGPNTVAPDRYHFYRAQ